LILIDSYGWIEYFTEGPLVNEYAAYVEKANSETYVTPTIVVYEVYKKTRSLYLLLPALWIDWRSSMGNQSES
jgi:hypothetical protein